MTRQLTEKTIALLHTLYDVEHRSWFGVARRNQELSALLEQIGERDELGAISAVARFLFAESPEVRTVVGHVIARLLASVSPEDLLHLNEVFDWSWRLQVSDVWNKLKPTGVESLVTDTSVRTPVLGLLSFHRNGYVRHEAVHHLAEIYDGTELPYLLIRQNDWVEPISRDARAAVEKRILDEYIVHFVHSLPLVAHLSAFKRRDHSAVLQRIVATLTQPRHEELLLSALRSAHRAVRRWVAKEALGLTGEHQARMVRFGVGADDPVIRLWSCRVVPSLLADEEIRQILGRLTKDGYGPVRSEAFWSGAKRFPSEAARTWQEALFDRSYTIREMAQSQLAKLGVTEVASLYRDELARSPDNVPALLGLGETGNETDLQVIRRYLTTGLPRRRRAAVRGLARLGGEGITNELIGCLRDDSPGVTREVKRQLEEPGRVLQGELLLAVVNGDTRLHCRDAAVRLMFSMGKWRSLPWLVYAAVHCDPDTAALAQRFIEAWFSPPLCNKVWTKPSSGEREAINTALSRSRDSLDAAFQHKLDTWLNLT